MIENTLNTHSWDLAPGLALCPLRTPTLPPATHTNCYIVGSAELIVIDPGSPYPEEQATLDDVLTGYATQGRRVREIWLTHHHRDHVGGALHLARKLSVPIAAHINTVTCLRGNIPVDRILSDGDILELPATAGIPRRCLRAVYTPGHAPGHLCFVEEETGYLIAGDMVAGVGTIVIDPDQGDMGDYLASLERIKHLGARALLPAHGAVQADPQAKLDEYIRHRLWREQCILAALPGECPMSAQDLLPIVYRDVPPAIYPLAERSLLAHLLKLVAEGKVRCTQDNLFQRTPPS